MADSADPKPNAYYINRRSALPENELRVLFSARDMMKAPGFQQIRQAHADATIAETVINDRPVRYQADLPAPYRAITLARGFALGPLAFRTETELVKTVLQEVFRLETGQSAQGVLGSVVSDQTLQASMFVEREWHLLWWLLRR